MSGNLDGFNANDVEPNEAFTALPAGEYDIIVMSSEMKPTKAGDGKYLQLQLQILSGTYQNRQLFDRLNLVNRNDVAVQIAKGTLSSICRAVNVLTPKDSSELHNKPLTAIVKVEKDLNGNSQNSVKGYKPRAAQGSMVEQAFEDKPTTENDSPF
tara:strand:+ start:940 stop:1404 length:465 start_codon:yes stop_codon:yes gene_type:complete